MDISVSSRHVDVSPAVKAAAKDKIGRLVRYLDGMERADVHFLEEHNPRIENRDVCEVTMFGHGHVVRAKVAAPDQFAAIDAAVAKLEHQLTKLKSRLVTYTKGKARAAKAGGHVGAGEAAALIGAPSVDGDAAVTPSPTDLERVVKRKRFAMQPMTIDEAVLQMELLAHQFFVFVLAETGEPAVLYQRDDGDIGMIEVEQTPLAG
jgi:ribosomal subunit interface protein